MILVEFKTIRYIDIDIDIDICLNLLKLTYSKYNNGPIAKQILMWKREERRESGELNSYVSTKLATKAHTGGGPYVK